MRFHREVFVSRHCGAGLDRLTRKGDGIPPKPPGSTADDAYEVRRAEHAFFLPRGSSMYTAVLAVGIGGALGSLLRWVLGVRLNALFIDLPLGTLAANLIAGYIIGVAIAFFSRYPEIPSEWRLFVITGLMGGLSTFSTFSAEVFNHLQAGHYAWALGEIGIHVTCSVLMTALGYATVVVFQ